MDLPVLLLITLICSWAPLGSSYDRCLKNYPDVHPKKYAVFDRKSINITIQVSSRVTHQLATHAFYIFLTEVIGYEKVYITQEEDNFQVDEVIEKLNDFNNPIPQAMINLEVWVPPEFDTFKIEWIRECGSVAPPGRFGWFIPLDLDIPVINFYKNRWYADVNEVHWTILRESNAVGYFDISPNVMKGLERFTRTNFESKEYICNDPICTQSMYIPDRCRGNNVKCAVLLAPSYNETSFVITHINELKLLVKVLWLGDNLKPAINYLKQTYKGNNRSSILILNWTPSDVILHEKDYISVAFKHCELLNSHNSVGCKYEMHRLVKFAWSKIESFAKPLYEALRSFKFDETSYSLLLDLYEKNGASSLHDVSCEWMKQQQTTWTHWKKNTTSYIYIGGIFPISESSYAGRGIVHGAVMAKNAINLNATILPDYRLKLLATDGKCSADHVMKNFIDFIVDNVKDNLIGVLGPACSDTVEPLAGVSRHFRIMVISYSAEGASFSNREKYPYFFRTIGENKAYKHVYLELFKAFQWKRIAALTEDGQKYTEYISLMQDKLEKNGIKFISNKKFPRERETEAMSRYLEDLKNKHARIIIADVVDEVARNVMCEAYRLKMTAVQGYVWFLPMWLNATWYNTDYFNIGRNETVNCTTAEMIKAITGYFAMTHAYFAPDNDVMQENITVRQWRQTYENTTSVTSNYAGFAYDAIWTYALALDKLSRTDPEALSNIHSEETTNKLVRLVEQTDFHGVSGRIKFRGGPSRFSVINIMEWYDNKTHIIGQFYPNLTDHTPEILGGNLKLNRTAIRWFTENRQIPGDGTLPPSVCAIEKFAQLLNVSCQTSVIVLNVIIGGILFCVVIGFGVYMKRNFDRKVKDAEKFYMKTCGPRANLDKWEIPRVNVVINRKLGEGAFGTVYGGEANLADKGWVAIAVKTLKVGSTTEEKLDFLSEAEMMKRFNHKNIVQLLGVCTKEEPVYTVMEFMLYGDLKTFLLARRHLVNSTSEESEEISSKKLTSMALDVACGLSYLALEKYVHRDIASRNCLINAQRVVKLGDFGMTRPICIENDIYQFSRKGMLPVRWMAPESLALGVFTPASDIWSYGVLLYEIITFGSFPFQGSSNAQVLEIVKTGKTLDIPKGVKPQLECLIKSCWCIESRGRPPASEIVEFLANNPRLITPCLDVPLSSVQLEDTDQLELLPNQMRKSSGTSVKISPTSNGTSIESKLPTSIPARPKSPVPVYTPKYDMNLDTVNITLENCCCKEPLLGRSSTSLKNLGKYVNVQHNRMDSGCQDEDEEYVAHSPPNGLTKL